jgi:ferrous iron transport protein B
MGKTPSTRTPTSHAVVALVGNPNTGKTTLFNVLTGYRQRVGNYPGVTVEKKSGRLRTSASAGPVDVIDLPGAYSLAANSEDEAIVLDVLLGQVDGAPSPDVLVVVLDATSLTRNLFLASQLAEIGKPMVCALNMIDLAEAAGLKVDCECLAAELGVPVVPVVATKETGIEALKSAIIAALNGKPAPIRDSFPGCVRAELEGLDRALNNGSANGAADVSRVELQQILLDPGGHHERRLVLRRGPAVQADLAQRRQRILDAGESLAEVEAQVRYERIGEICRKAVTRVHPERGSGSEFADRFLTHRVAGPVVLIIILGLCFQAIYTWALPLMDAIDGTILGLGAMVASVLPEGAVQSMIVNGAIAGVGAVLVFLPQILILFLFLAILEDCGYMARAAFLLDRWMGYLGLSGKSFIPLISSFACAVPGIMATRVIEDRRDRFVTILIAPLMSCSARLPVYLLLIGAFIPAVPLLGGGSGFRR